MMYRLLMNLFGLSFRRRQPWQKNPEDCFTQEDVNATMAEHRAQFERKMLLGLMVFTKSQEKP